tara:strand:+ start:384 stop:758 length:375 start_codon:yes stop_codon:yes gene_type:complete
MKITKRQLRRIIKEEKARLLNEVTPTSRARELDAVAKDAAAEARTAHRLANNAKRSQLTLNQPEVDAVEKMAQDLEDIFFAFRQIASIPQSWVDSGDYDKMEDRLLSMGSDLEDLAKDMKKGGI